MRKPKISSQHLLPFQFLWHTCLIPQLGCLCIQLFGFLLSTYFLDYLIDSLLECLDPSLIPGLETCHFHLLCNPLLVDMLNHQPKVPGCSNLERGTFLRLGFLVIAIPVLNFLGPDG